MISFKALDRDGILFSNWKSSTFFKVSSSRTMLIIGFCVGISLFTLSLLVLTSSQPIIQKNIF